MYCNKCGKKIADGEILCEECKAEEAKSAAAEREVTTYFGDERVTKPAAPKYTRMFGFGPSLASAITSIVGVAFVFVAFIYRLAIIVMKIAQRETGEVIPEEVFVIFTTLAITFTVIGLICAIIGLIFGIKAIGHVKEAKSDGVKPIAPMILSIVGTVSAGIALALFLMTMIVLFI